MKFSDMMGKGAKTEDAVDTAVPAAPVNAPPVPEAPIRFLAAPGPAEPAPVDPVAEVVGTPEAVVAPEAVTAPEPVVIPAQPAIADVMAELAPRRAEASTEQLDASAWLDGLTAIDDDLLPS